MCLVLIVGLANNFTLANVAAETKGEDKTVSNQISQPGDSADHKVSIDVMLCQIEVLIVFQPLSTAGPGGLGPKKHQGLQSHEVDPALALNPDKDNSQGHGKNVNPTD